MTVTERLMGVGQWDLSLKTDTPRTVLDQLDVRRVGFGHVVVTPTPVPVGAQDDTLLARSRYVGVYRKQTEFTMSGAGVNMWVADEDGKGPTYVTEIGGAPSTFDSWRWTLKPSFLTMGVTSTVPGTYEHPYERTDLRAPLDEVCRFFEAEWQVTNDFNFNMGYPADLFRMDPKAVIVRHGGGRDLNVLGIEGDLEVTRDVEDWVRTIRQFTGTSDAPVQSINNGGISDDNVRFRRPDGGAVIMDKIIENFGLSSSYGAGFAAAAYKANKDPRQELRLSTAQYDIGQDVRVGDNVHVFDPSRGVYDQTQEVQYRGQTIYPETIRCVGMQWPIRRGMGVYFRYFVKPSSTWEVRWLDLTNFVEWEDKDTEIEVGVKPRPPVKRK